MAEYGKGFVLDTCAIINILQNRAVADLIKHHIDSENSRVYLTDVALAEASRKGYTKKEVILKIQKYLNTFVIVKEANNNTLVEAKRLENTCSLIHPGDSIITAFSLENSSTLVTYDKDLIEGCTVFGIPTLNPNWVIRGQVA